MINPNDAKGFLIIMETVRDIAIGAVSGIIAYLFDYQKAKRNGDTKFVFRFSSLTINMAMGAFVAHMVGTLIPIDTFGRDAIIGLSGVTAYQILLLAESKFASWLFEKLQGKK
jgi:hypothetical protein